MDKTQTGEQIGTKLCASIREMKAHKRGRVTQVEVPNAALARRLLQVIGPYHGIADHFNLW